ncbi:glycosyl hydrolase [Saccharicrinis aurantiacus]|uniref:glycosyl hydrolase n=1 Tax=Saccharicrinis aurantiacus TaxID=1849719 RepID=UPI002490B3CB|nr:glycosyl hydrolase [Saccharicrinis aurantiacus]
MKTYITLILVVVLPLISCYSADEEKGLVYNFKNPPAASKARTWWHWMNGNVSEEGITADLEAMKKVGIKEAQIFNANIGIPQGSAVYLSDEWLELLKYSAEEAKRLDIDLAFHNCPGWSSSGGPWVTPEYAMQTLVYNEITLQGGQVFNDKLPQPQTNLNYYKDIAVLAFPKPQSDIRISNLDYKSLSSRVRNHLEPDARQISSAAVVHQSDIIDLTSKIDKEGNLNWLAPDGQWLILRLGHTPTGKKNISAPNGAQGLECDKMSRDAVDAFWKDGISPIIDKLDTLVGTVLKNCIIDSYEVGCANWTPDFKSHFKKLRNYNCTLYLPTLAGYYVDSGEKSERFLWDFRRTIGDLIAENYYAYFRDKCHEHNMTFSVEPYWGPFDNMQVGATGDIVMSEFWSGELAFFDSPKFVASIAKLNGSSIVGAEAFTDMGGWSRHPAQLKVIGDMAWAQGINRFIFHTYVHQPWDVAPGLALGPFGMDFNRLNTWWNQGVAFMDYIARSQYLLQQGMSYADILVFTGESSPNDGILMPEIKAMGYDYDLIGSNKINELTVKDGLICTKHGAKYKALVFPETPWIRPETMHIVEQLAESGATIFATKANKSPSLQNYPQCDAQVAQVSDKLWDRNLIQDGSVIDFLKSGDLQPDFSVLEGGNEDISFIHRASNEGDIYFLANARNEAIELKCRFRIANKQPEFWNAETGEISNTSVWADNGDGTTTLSVFLEQEGSIFVVFREPSSANKHVEKVIMQYQKPPLHPLQNLEIIKAEYGTFLPQGLVDVSEIVRAEIKDNKLNVVANRDLCSCDPAPGYKKELRIQYKVGAVQKEINAMEKEQLSIDEKGAGELTVVSAVFGKFEGGVEGIPASKPVYDVTPKLKNMLASGLLEILVDDSLTEGVLESTNKKALRLVYTTNGVEYTTTLPYGSSLNLAQANALPKLVTKNGDDLWLTPYAVQITYQTSVGKDKTIKVKTVPKAINLSEGWDVNFAAPNSMSTKVPFKELSSWSLSSDDNIRFFSGTASYTKQFELSKELLQSNYSLELDLGSVFVIAEVILNGENLGVLWKAPYRINMDGVAKEGTNTLEVRVTNMWPNRLIGDEFLSKDFESRGPNIKQWPNWLLQKGERPSQRQTFASYKHWRKDDKLQTSGLIGPVTIVVSKVVKLKY